MGWGSGVAVSCDVGRKCGSDPTLLWLWCRPAAVALIQPLAWESPYAAGGALKGKKKKTKTKTESNVNYFISELSMDFPCGSQQNCPMGGLCNNFLNCFNDFQLGKVCLSYYISLKEGCNDEAQAKKAEQGVLLWLTGLRIWRCHCSGLGHCCGTGLIPGWGTSTCQGYAQKRRKKRQNVRETREFPLWFSS